MSPLPGESRTKVKEATLALNSCSVSQQQKAISAKVRRTPIMCCLRAGLFFFLSSFFLFSRRLVLSKLFSACQRPEVSTQAPLFTGPVGGEPAEYLVHGPPPHPHSRSTGHSSPTGCPALAPSRALKDALSGGARAPAGRRLTWIKHPGRPLGGALSPPAVKRWETSSRFGRRFPRLRNSR